MILEQLHEYLVPEQEMRVSDGISDRDSGVHRRKRATAQTDRRIHSSGVFEMSLGNGGESWKGLIFPMRSCMDLAMDQSVWRSVLNISAETIGDPGRPGIHYPGRRQYFRGGYHRYR